VPLHLVKLCVGCDTPQDLVDWRAQRRARGGRVSVVQTRQTPRRAAEILDGGCLYWVFKGQILVRQRVQQILTLEEGPRRRCEIILEDVLIPTAPQPRRPFQGWRYLDAKDAPADLPQDETGEGMPRGLATELRELGAW
jgi:hypothetical protein